MNASLQFRNQINRFAFSLRSRLRWKQEYSESGQHDLQSLPARYRELFDRYHFQEISSRLNQHSLLLNLSKLDQLEMLFGHSHFSLPAQHVNILDLGSQHFVYAPALSRFFSLWNLERGREVELTGIELDAYRRNWKGQARCDLGRYYASLASRGHYLIGDLLHYPFAKQFDVLCFFRPFLAPEPLIQAGLPKRFFEPQAQWQRVKDLLKPGGDWLLSYQSEYEAQEGMSRLRELGIHFQDPRIWEPIPGSVEQRPQWFQRVRLG